VAAFLQAPLVAAYLQALLAVYKQGVGLSTCLLVTLRFRGAKDMQETLLGMKIKLLPCCAFKLQALMAVCFASHWWLGVVNQSSPQWLLFLVVQAHGGYYLL